MSNKENFPNLKIRTVQFYDKILPDAYNHIVKFNYFF